MASSFDRRVVPDALLSFLRACQRGTGIHLGGGVALSGVYLRHRLSADVDLFCHDAERHRGLVDRLPEVAAESNAQARVVRDAGYLVRVALELASGPIAVDIVHEPIPDVEPPPPPVEGVTVESLADLRASKLTCILSRSEPRDLVDLCFLDRAGFRPEDDLALAVRKDGGIDPGVLAWLLGQFPLEPLPTMLVPFSVADLGRFREDLRERMRRCAAP